MIHAIPVMTLRIGLGLCLLFPCLVLANNLQISNVALNANDTANQFVLVEFDLSWENSWRIDYGPNNHDAAWIFIKFRKDGELWQHASINYVNGSAVADGHVAPAGATILTPTDGRGVFIYRDAVGSGHNHWTGVKLRWNYGADGVSVNDAVEVDVYGIEMVWVPTNRFTLGGGGGNEVGKIYRWQGPLLQPGYLVDSEQQITVGQNSGNLFYKSPIDWDAGDQLGPIPQQFPKGFQAFYCMKYELNQRQWINFFNSLNLTQQQNNDITDLDHRGPNPIDRNNVEWEGVGGAYTMTPFVPLSFPQWGEVLAYADWAGLRPMTELEFIKACRGPLNPLAHEYAWGSSNIIDKSFTYDLLNKNGDDELLVNHVPEIGNANWINSAIFEDGPYRCGIFAASAKHKNREETGGTYYGIMEMSGNLSEMCVTIGTAEGRAFIGNHGDGMLDTNGEADVVGWPPITGEGGGLFGGSWFSLGEELKINERRSATIGNVGYFNDVGFRCVRTAPN